MKLFVFALVQLCFAQEIILETDAIMPQTESTAGIDAHVLDVTKGKGAGGIPVTLFKEAGGDTWTKLDTKTTQESGRTPTFESLVNGALEPGVYKLEFQTAAYFAPVKTFYPYIPVIFEVKEDETQQNFHVPITLAPQGYNTYRGV